MGDGVSGDAAPPAPVTGIDLKVGFSGANRGRLCLQVDTRDSVGDKTTQALFRSLEEGRTWTEEVVFNWLTILFLKQNLKKAMTSP